LAGGIRPFGGIDLWQTVRIISMRWSLPVVATTLIALGGGWTAATLPVNTASSAPNKLFVNPSGSDHANGLTAQHPFKTIQAALNHATPGVTIELAPGSYREKPVTRVNGTPAAPITIEGTDTGFNPAGRASTVLYGSGRVFSIDNSYYRLQGFTINGEPKLPKLTYPTAPAAATDFKNSVRADVVDSSLIYIGADPSITGSVINDMFLTDAGSDCVRIGNDATANEVVDSTIQWCGMFGKNEGAGVFTYHNGEGVYVGTSPKSTDEPHYADDDTSNTTVQGNVIHTFGSECLDVKEHAHDNTFVDNVCADNAEPLSYYGSDVELRGYDNSVISNTIGASLGYGLKIASDATSDPQGGNIVKGNTFSGDAGSPIRNDQAKAQGVFCGNTFPVANYLHGRTVGSATLTCAKTANAANEAAVPSSRRDNPS
jgi:hypothetical protein